MSWWCGEWTDQACTSWTCCLSPLPTFQVRSAVQGTFAVPALQGQQQAGSRVLPVLHAPLRLCPPPCMSPLSGPAPGAGIEEQVARRVKQCERWRASKPPRFHARGSQIYRAPAAEEMTRDGA